MVLLSIRIVVEFLDIHLWEAVQQIMNVCNDSCHFISCRQIKVYFTPDRSFTPDAYAVSFGDRRKFK
jgi:hypothetical protein